MHTNQQSLDVIDLEKKFTEAEEDKLFDYGIDINISRMIYVNHVLIMLLGKYPNWKTNKQHAREIKSHLLEMERCQRFRLDYLIKEFQGAIKRKV